MSQTCTKRVYTPGESHKARAKRAKDTHPLAIWLDPDSISDCIADQELRQERSQFIRNGHYHVTFNDYLGVLKDVEARGDEPCLYALVSFICGDEWPISVPVESLTFLRRR